MPYTYEQTNADEIAELEDKLYAEAKARGPVDFDALSDALPEPIYSEPVYLPPPEFGGHTEPARFRDPETGEPLPLTETWGQRDTDYLDGSRRELLTLFLKVAAERGVVALRCPYNGGHDEGFARLDWIELEDGTRVDGDRFVDRVLDGAMRNRFEALGRAQGMHTRGFDPLRDVFRHELPLTFVLYLMSPSYGTAQDSSYGAAIVDIAAGTVRDDRDVMTHPVISDQ